MADNGTDIENVVLTELLRLNATIMGIITGLLVALGIFVATNFLILKGGPNVGLHLNLLGQFFPGYTVTFMGSLIGAAYGFVTGFVIGYVVCAIYNWVADYREMLHRKKA
jgi:hypothetical protein